MAFEPITLALEKAEPQVRTVVRQSVSSENPIEKFGVEGVIGASISSLLLIGLIIAVICLVLKKLRGKSLEAKQETNWEILE